MKAKEYLFMIVKALNPDSHRKLVRLHAFTLLKYMIFLMVLCSLVSVGLLVPKLANYKGDLASELDKFEEFQIDTTTSLEGEVVLLEKPKISVDFGKEKLTNEWILFNKEKAMYNKYLFFGYEELTLSEYEDASSPESQEFYLDLLVFIMPAVLFWIFLAYLIKNLVLMSVFSLLGWFFFISSKNHVTIHKAFKVAVFTATPMIILELALWPLKPMLVIPLIVYVVYFVIGLVMVADRKYSHRRGQEAFEKKHKEKEFWDELKENVEKNS